MSSIRVQPPVVLLGPQTHRITLGEAFASWSIEDNSDSPIATITAGWQEREPEVDELDRELSGRSLNLRLHQRAELVFSADPELATAHQKTQRELFQLERHYQIRLSRTMEAAVELSQLTERSKDEGQRGHLQAAKQDTMQSLRELDDWHLRRVEALREDFTDRLNPLERDAVAEQRAEIADILSGAAAVAIAGGHVAVLLNRLKLFQLEPLLNSKPLFAWSAGAMVLTERVVLFHDHPPQGPGVAAVLERGLGRCPGVVALPNGRKRLALEDQGRVARFAQRFAPHACVLLETGDRLEWNGSSWSAQQGAYRLGLEGELVEAGSW